MSKRQKPDAIKLMDWNDMVKLRSLGFEFSNLNKRKNKLYVRRIKKRYNELLSTMKLLGLEENTSFMV